MDRRSFLALTPSSRNKTAPVKAARTLSGLAPYTGAWSTAQVVHLLKRAMFGATPADVNYFKGLSMSAAVDALLNHVDAVPSPPVNNYSADMPDPNVVAGASWVMAPPANDEDLDTARRYSFKAWWLGLMVNQERSIREKMTLFWHNHFATEANTIQDGRYVYHHNVMLRQNALGNFKALTKAVTLDPGMLVYLNGYLNEKTAADENYARELLELFTCGKGPESQYTEDDVRSAARVLTGYRINPTTITSFFDATKHDLENKSFSPFLFSKVISGRTGADGTKELDELLNIIFQQPEVAKFLCRKFYRFFVYYDIDDATETNVIEPLAEIFRTGNYEIKPLLSALFKSEHFYDPLNMSCLIKSPVDFSVGMCREFGVAFPPVSDYEAAYAGWQAIQAAAGDQQQNIGDPPLVSGWEAYFQEPQFHELWINTDTLPKRNMLSDLMITTGYTRGGATVSIDPLTFASQLSDPSDPVLLVSESLEILYRMDVSAATKEFLKKDILLSGEEQDYYWTNAWNAWIVDPSNMMNKNVLLIRLQALYKYIMNLSEYQLA